MFSNSGQNHSGDSRRGTQDDDPFFLLDGVRTDFQEIAPELETQKKVASDPAEPLENRLEAFEDTCRRLNRLFEKEGKTIDLYRDIGPKALKKDKNGRIIEHGPLRWHYLRVAMVENGMAKDRKEANILIAPGGPCYHQR